MEQAGQRLFPRFGALLMGGFDKENSRKASKKAKIKRHVCLKKDQINTETWRGRILLLNSSALVKWEVD